MSGIREKSKVKRDGFGVEVRHIENCARCGENHDKIWFSRLTRPMLCDGLVNNYWAICPVTREPIIMAMQSEQELNFDGK